MNKAQAAWWSDESVGLSADIDHIIEAPSNAPGYYVTRYKDDTSWAVEYTHPGLLTGNCGCLTKKEAKKLVKKYIKKGYKYADKAVFDELTYYKALVNLIKR